MTKTAPHFRQISTPLDVPDHALDQVNSRLGVPTMVMPAQPPAPPIEAAPIQDAEQDAETPKVQPVTTAKRQVVKKSPLPAEPTPRAAMDKLTIELPRYVSDAIKRDAIDRHTTVRHIVMLGLQAHGIEILAADLVPDARRSRDKAR